MRHKAILPLIGLFLLLALFGPGVAPARAGDFRSGETVVIAADEVIDDDLFVTAETIEINGTITGDLIAAGRVIVIHGTVGGSAALAGQTIDILGKIDGSLYSGGYALTLGEGSEIGRNVYFGGYSLTTEPDSRVGRDIYVSGAQVSHNGTVDGDLNVNTGALEIGGMVGGDVAGEVTTGGSPGLMGIIMEGAADLDPVASGLVMRPEARIGGQVSVVQETDTASQVVARIGELIGILLGAIILIRRAPQFLPAVGDILRQRPVAGFGWGAVVLLLLFPLALIVGLALILLLTLVVTILTLGQFTGVFFGLTGGFLLFALFAFLAVAGILTWIVAGFLLGRRFLARDGRDESRRRTQLLYVALGALILQVLRAVPFLGFIVAFLVITFGLGALFLYWMKTRRARKTIQPVVAPVEVTK